MHFFVLNFYAILKVLFANSNSASFLPQTISFPKVAPYFTMIRVSTNLFIYRYNLLIYTYNLVELWSLCYNLIRLCFIQLSIYIPIRFTVLSFLCIDISILLNISSHRRKVNHWFKRKKFRWLQFLMMNLM